MKRNPELLGVSTVETACAVARRVSRQVNYLGEITQAVAIALASGYFPAHYVALMLTRQADDDKVCRAKYGELWDRYTAKVRYRIVPRIY